MITNKNLAPNGLNIISQPCNDFPLHFEIDTVRLFIDSSQLENINNEFLIDLLSKKQFEENGDVAGWFKNFKIKITKHGITIYGSLSNYFYSAFQILSFHKLKEAVTKLGNELKLDLHKARLYRVDCNWNVITNEDIGCYNKSLFYDLPRFKRLEQVEGVSFRNKSKQFVIYNKSQELKDKQRGNIDNWLRFEYRIIKNVKKHLGIKMVKELYNPDNYYALMKQLMNYYFKIRKRNFEEETLVSNTVKEFKRSIIKKGCLSFGEDKLFKSIEIMDSLKKFSNRQQKSALKRWINKTIDSEIIDSHSNNLIEELNRKIYQNFTGEIETLKIDN